MFSSKFLLQKLQCISLIFASGFVSAQAPTTTMSPPTTTSAQAPTTTMLPSSPAYSVFRRCTDLPFVRQQQRCAQIDQQYRTSTGEAYFTRFVLIRQAEGVNSSISSYYDEATTKPATVFFLDRNLQEEYYIDREIEPEGSFALVGIEGLKGYPEIEVTATFKNDLRTKMLEIEDRVITSNELDLMVIDGVRFDPVIPSGEALSNLISVIDSDRAVKLNRVVITNCEFREVADAQDEHIYLSNAVGEVLITDNTFVESTLRQETVDITCRPDTQEDCSSTRVFFTNNYIRSIGIPFSTLFQDIASFEIASNYVAFGTYRSTTTTEYPIFDIRYEDLPEYVTVSGSIHDNNFTGAYARNVNAVDIFHNPRDEVVRQSGTVYHYNNIFGDGRAVLRDDSLPNLQLLAQVEPLCPTAEATFPSAPACTPAASSMQKISNSTSPASDCRLQNYLSVGLGCAAGLGIYEAFALGSYAIATAGATVASDISTAWHFFTLGVSALAQYRLKRTGRVLFGSSDNISMGSTSAKQ